MHPVPNNSLDVFTKSLSSVSNQEENCVKFDIKRKNAATDQLEDASEAELGVLSTKARLAEVAQVLDAFLTFR